MRIAMYGFVDSEAGSQSSAGYLLTRELLRRGVEISFYAIEGFIKPKGFENESRFQYIPVRHPIARFWRYVERIPQRSLRQTVTVLFSQLSNHLHYASIADRIRHDHACQPFDCLFCNGLLCPFSVDGLRIVSWSQGCPLGELQSIRRNASRIFRSNPPLLLGLEAMYFLKMRQASRTEGFSEKIICGSNQSRKHWMDFGVPENRLVAIPYPMDEDLFAIPPKRTGKEIRFLHLGRIVPRKRIDLLVGAFVEFHKSHPYSVLQIVGRFGYASRLDRKTVLRPHPAIHYQEFVPRHQVAKLMAECQCIIQPSENEDFGSAVAEGLLCGRPAIVGPTNGMVDYLGQHSIMFDSYDISSVLKAMNTMATTLSQNPENMERECREQAVRTFRASKVCDEVIDLVFQSSDSKCRAALC